MSTPPAPSRYATGAPLQEVPYAQPYGLRPTGRAPACLCLIFQRPAAAYRNSALARIGRRFASRATAASRAAEKRFCKERTVEQERWVREHCRQPFREAPWGVVSELVEQWRLTGASSKMGIASE